MSAALQYFLAGLGIGGIYALVAIGFHIMWSSAKAVNFAHGDTLMLGAVLTIVFLDHGIAMPVAILLSIGVAIVFGVVLERVAIRPFADQAASIGWMLTTIAIGIMLESYATIEFGAFARPLPSPRRRQADHHFRGRRLYSGTADPVRRGPDRRAARGLPAPDATRARHAGRRLQPGGGGHRRHQRAARRHVLIRACQRPRRPRGASWSRRSSRRRRPWACCSGSRVSRSRSSAELPAPLAS